MCVKKGVCVCVKEGVCVCFRERKCVSGKGEQGRVMRRLCECACVKERTCVNVCKCIYVTSATRYAPFETCAPCV